eukprot:4443733-Prymnesium_polylepis.1
MASENNILEVQLAVQRVARVIVRSHGVVVAFDGEVAVGVEREGVHVFRWALDVREDDDESVRHVPFDGVPVHGVLPCGAMAEDHDGEEAARRQIRVEDEDGAAILCSCVVEPRLRTVGPKTRQIDLVAILERVCARKESKREQQAPAHREVKGLFSRPTADPQIDLLSLLHLLYLPLTWSLLITRITRETSGLGRAPS